jgi:NAD-dependent SIR2 family protein deacetylase
MSGREIPPRCPACGGVLRPKVVLFGEALPEDELERFIIALQEGFDIVFSIGTSSVFPYIVQPVVYAASAGIPTVEINPAHPTERHRRLLPAAGRRRGDDPHSRRAGNGRSGKRLKPELARFSGNWCNAQKC